VKDREAWEEEAERWVRFARAPGHDAYWYYRDSFFDGIVPPPGSTTLEIGCGEGRVTRDLLARGHRTVSLDGSMTLLRAATDIDPVGRYLLVRSGSVDLAVAYNSLMDFDDLVGAVAEVARVLSPGGTFCVCVTHPLQFAGGFDGDEVEASFVLHDAYFGTHPVDETVSRADVTIRFRGWSRPIEDYFSALFDAGFVVDALSEPRPITDEGRYARWHRFPMFLSLRAIKRQPRPPGAEAGAGHRTSRSVGNRGSIGMRLSELSVMARQRSAHPRPRYRDV
jgi:SAM-dependent methyltransferase